MKTSITPKLAGLLTLWLVFPVTAQQADTLLIDGKILTVDNKFNIVQALAISGDRIIAVGSTPEISELAGPDTRVINLEGATVVPGLIDNHFHFLRAEGARHPAPGLATFQPPYGSLIQQIAPTSETQLEQNLTDFMHTLNSHGLTALYSLGRGPEGEDYVLEDHVDNGTLPMRIWHTLTYEANDPAGADAAVTLINNSTPNTFDGEYGQFGLGEHIYLPFFDFPAQSGPWPEPVMASLMD